MVIRNIVTLCLFFFILSSTSVFAVEPTTFPTNKNLKTKSPTAIVPDDGTGKVDPKKPRSKGTLTKNTSITGVLVEPTAIERTAPKSK